MIFNRLSVKCQFKLKPCRPVLFEMKFMKKALQIISVGVLFFLLLSSAALKEQITYDSFKPGQLWLDNKGTHINAHGGGIIFFNDTYYWFGEHKVAGRKGNSAWVGFHCYSSKDLYNWRDEGIVLEVSKDPNSPIIQGCVMERPKVVYNNKTKKFVMWFHHELKNQGYKAARCGVAVSDKVMGPYIFIKSVRPDVNIWPMNVTEEQKQDKSLQFVTDYTKGQESRDMTIFMDDDGAAYHIYSSESNKTTHISKLSDDYTDHSGKYIRVFEDRYMEAHTIFKRNGKYYFIASGCTGWAPNAARSAVADSIWGPWKELGNPCRGTDEQNKITFESQSTFILPVQGKKDSFIFMADRWRPRNAIDGRYIWLPIEWEDEIPVIKWYDQWDLSFFDK